MSHFLSITNSTFSPGTDDATVFTAIDDAVIAAGWRHASVFPTEGSDAYYIPPASEAFGSGALQQFVHLTVQGGVIGLSGGNRIVDDYSSDMFVVQAHTASSEEVSTLAVSGKAPAFIITGTTTGASTDVLITGFSGPGPGVVKAGDLIVSSVGGVTPPDTFIASGSGGVGVTVSTSVTLPANTDLAYAVYPCTIYASGDSGSDETNLRALYDFLTANAGTGELVDWQLVYVPTPVYGVGSVTQQNDAIMFERNFVEPLAPCLVVAITPEVTSMRLADAVNSVYNWKKLAYKWSNWNPMWVNAVNGSDDTNVILSVFSRTITIASYTTGFSPAFSGPSYASYIDHSQALAMMPRNPGWLIYQRAGISELVVGTLDFSQSVGGLFSPVNGWVMARVYRYAPTATSNAGSVPTSTSGAASFAFFTDTNGAAYFSNPGIGAGVQPNEAAYLNWDGAVVGQAQQVVAGNVEDNYTLVTPPFCLDDVYMFSWDITTGEAEIKVGDTVYGAIPPNVTTDEIYLMANIPAGYDVLDSITVSDTSKLDPGPASVVIAGAIYSYTSVGSSTTLLSVTRTNNAACTYVAYTGTQVTPALCFMTINHGFVPLGQAFSTWPFDQTLRPLRMQNGLLHYPVVGASGPGPTVETTRPTQGTVWPRLAVYGSVKVVG